MKCGMCGREGDGSGGHRFGDGQWCCPSCVGNLVEAMLSPATFAYRFLRKNWEPEPMKATDLLLPDLLNVPIERVHEALRALGLSHTAPWLVGKCPACGGAYALGVKADDPKGRAIFHSFPACERALELPPGGFLQWARTEGGPTLQRRGGNLAELR